MAKIDMRKKQSPVRITVDNTHCKIEGLNSAVVIAALDLQLSYKVEGAEFTQAYKKGYWSQKEKRWVKWNGRQRLFRNGNFLTGLLKRVLSVLKNHKVSYTVIDKRIKPKIGKPIGIKKAVKARAYQDRVMDAIKKNKFGIVSVATGGGKSIIIAQTCSNFNCRTVVFVTSIDLLYQTRDAIEGALKGTKVGIIGDGVVDVKKISVCTIWTSANVLGKKYVKCDDEDSAVTEKINLSLRGDAKAAIVGAEMILIDECQLLGSNTLQLINVATPKAFYKFGFSGTPFRDDGKDLLLEAVCGQTIIEVTASELIKSGFLVKPKIKFIEVPEYEGTLSPSYSSIYKEYIVENEVRNKKIIKAANKLTSSGRRTLILVKNIRHGEILLSMFPKNCVVYFVKGNVKSEERNRIRQDFIDGKIDVIIATIIFDQGIDLPNLDSLILAGSGRSRGRCLQRLGRVIRAHPGKKDAIVVDFIDNAKYLLQHSAKRLETYRREAEFKIILPERKKNGKAKNEKKKAKRLPEYEEW